MTTERRLTKYDSISLPMPGKRCAISVTQLLTASGHVMGVTVSTPVGRSGSSAITASPGITTAAQELLVVVRVAGFAATANKVHFVCPVTLVLTFCASVEAFNTECFGTAA